MKKIFIVLLLVFVLAIPASARNNFETVSVLSSGVSTLTSAKIDDPTQTQQEAVEAYITVTVGAVNFTVDGTTPTTGATGVGHQVPANGTIDIIGHASIKAFKVIGTTGAATLHCTYFFEKN